MKGVEGLVEFEPIMACGESWYEDVDFGPFDPILFDAGVHGFQDVVGTETEGADIEGGIRDETKQMGRVLDCDGGGFVDTLAEFAPEAVQHELGGSLASGIFGNAGDVQSDAFSFQVAKNVVSFLLHGLTPTEPPRRFLF